MPDAPVPDARPTVVAVHHDERVDEYHWLRDRDDPAVLAHLEAENAYTEAMTAHLKPLEEALYKEMVGRIQETDMTVPYREGTYLYYSRTQEGSSYRIYCRKRGPDGEEEVLLDENQLAEGQPYYRTGVLEVSPDARLLAFSVDLTGNERYVLRFKDLTTGELLPDTVSNTKPTVAWASDSRTVFFTVADEIDRPWRLFRHTLGAPVEEDVLVLQEDDRKFYVSAYRTLDGRFIVAQSRSKVTSEVSLIDAGDPSAPLRLVEPRRQDHLYQVTHRAGRFWILSNDGAANFRVFSVPLEHPGRERWEEVVPHRAEVYLERMWVFADHLVLLERDRGLQRIAVHDLHSGELREAAFEEATYALSEEPNAEFRTSTFRFGYSSPVTPRSVYDLDLDTGARELRKREPVRGGYEPSAYATTRLSATAPDGTSVPISLAHRSDLRPDATAPVLLCGYGAYGIPYDPVFLSTHLSLIDRGVVLAIAHVRGGGDLGRPWYDAGKYLKKRNTFSDFLAAAEHLIATGWAAPDRICAYGGSAGGLLVGAAINQRPGMFRAAVARVPFVDCLNTMLDDTLPLTVTEWEEWGNPHDLVYYTYMKSYSPYDNLTAQEYPEVLMTAGLNDPRVGYWEPAKWVARARSRKVDDRPVLLKINLEAGHGGASGRYEALRELAFVFAFVLDRLGVGEG